MSSVNIIDGVKWYPYLVEKEGRPSHLVLFSQKLKSARQLYIRMTYNGYKSFASFSCPISLHNYIKRRPAEHRCFDEIISDSYQKVRFDIDIEEKTATANAVSQTDKTKESDQTKIKLDNLIQNVTDSLITAMFNLIPDLKPERIMYFSSHGDNKRSVHLVFPEYHTSCCGEAQELYRQLMKFVPKQYIQYIDHGIYGDNRSLRLMNCCKWGSNRFKRLNKSFMLSGTEITYEGVKPDTSNVRFISSLISFITDSRCLPNLLAPKQKIRRELLPGGIVSLCVERAKIMLGDDYTFEYEGVEGSVIILRRIAPSYCRICRRVHDSQHPYLLLYDSELYFNCRRCDKGRLGLSLGDINSKEFTEMKNIEDLSVQITNIEDGGKIVKSRGAIFYLGAKKHSLSESSSESSGSSIDCPKKLESTETVRVSSKTKVSKTEVSKTEVSTVKKSEAIRNFNASRTTSTSKPSSGPKLSSSSKPSSGPKLSSSSTIADILNSSHKKDPPRRRPLPNHEKKKVRNIINIENIAW